MSFTGLHCCHCGRFSVMLHRTKWGLRFDYSYCSHCRTLDLVGREYYVGSTRTEYLFSDDYSYMEDRYYCGFMYGFGRS